MFTLLISAGESGRPWFVSPRRGRGHVPLAPSGTRVVVNNWINALNPEARSLLEREGYTPVRYFFRMEITFSEEPPAASWPTGITAQAGADEDLRPFYETSEEAMADHWGYVPRSYEDWRERRERSNFDPSLWFLALDDEVPAGAVLCSVSDGIGWIDALMVRRPWRAAWARLRLADSCISRALCARDAANGARRRCREPTRATRLYERAGMQIGQQYATYGKELPGRDRADRCRRSVRAGDSERVEAGIGIGPDRMRQVTISKVIC